MASWVAGGAEGLMSEKRYRARGRYGRLLSAALQSQQAFLQLTSSSIEGECQAYLRAALGGVNRGAHRGSCVLPRCFLACESLRRRLGAQGVLD